MPLSSVFTVVALASPEMPFLALKLEFPKTFDHLTTGQSRVPRFFFDMAIFPLSQSLPGLFGKPHASENHKPEAKSTVDVIQNASTTSALRGRSGNITSNH